MNLFREWIERMYLSFENNLVYYDSLTKVKTRMYYDRVAKSKYLKDECFVIFIDIDNLKYVNDNKGHHEGNLLIQHVVEKLKELPDTTDICRIGGDEFIVFATKDFDIKYLKHLRNVSYGYYIKDAFEDVSSAVRKSDEYMYKSKQRKKKKRKYRNDRMGPIVK